MASTKYGLPPLDYKMRAVLAQSQDLDEALEGFGKKKKDEWTTV